MKFPRIRAVNSRQSPNGHTDLASLPASQAEPGAADSLLAMLQAGGVARETGSAALQDQLVRAALSYLHRHQYSAGVFGADDLHSVAEDFAQDALTIVLDRLDSFHGRSRLTTWAYQILINLIADDFRRRAWRRRRFDDTTFPLPGMREIDSQPEVAAERNELWSVIDHCIRHELTPRQRQALVGRIVEEKPLVVLADELHTNKDNVYKLVHDARKHLKRALLSAGLLDGVGLHPQPLIPTPHLAAAPNDAVGGCISD